MSNTDRFKVLSKGFLKNKDIAAVLECSKAQASKIMKEIKKQIEESGQKPYQSCVSATAFLKYFGWNLKDIHNKALMEKKLEEVKPCL